MFAEGSTALSMFVLTGGRILINSHSTSKPLRVPGPPVAIMGRYLDY